ncbi:MAG: 2OG-Fe(II) oxygenase [Cyanobacteria bacterium P01_F01_bin.143]
MFHSVLEKARRADICYYPYPHLVIENCLPEDYYQKLSEEYPDDDLTLKLNQWRNQNIEQNQRNDISAFQALKNKSLLSQLWIEFIEYHTSQAFYTEILNLLGPEIKTIYPSIEHNIGKRLDVCSTGIRFDPKTDNGEISLDCQVGINTSVSRKSSVRRVHTDAIEELYAMLLYFRREEDDSQGGDLEIYKWKDKSERKFNGEEIDEKEADYVKNIRYAPNTLVIFINSANSLHAVSQRSITKHSRRLVNIIGEVYQSVPDGLFVKHQQNQNRSLLGTTKSLIKRSAKKLIRPITN